MSTWPGNTGNTWALLGVVSIFVSSPYPGAYPGGGGAEGARAPPFVSEGVLVKGANPRSFLERNLQFHTRIYCVHDCRSTIAPRRRAIVKLIFVESRVSRLTIPYTCTRFSVLPGVTSNRPSRFRKSCTRAFSFMQTSAAAVRLHF